MKFPVLNRKLHRWGALIAGLPLLVIICSGILLQLKKEFEWIQPPTATGSLANAPALGFARILDAARGVAEADVKGWEDIDRLDVRPDKGIVKVRCRNRWEIQVDTATGEVLQTRYRRSDLIESIHDGSWFHEGAKIWVFLPVGLALLMLWSTGLYLWLLPHWARRRRNQSASRK